MHSSKNIPYMAVTIMYAKKNFLRDLVQTLFLASIWHVICVLLNKNKKQKKLKKSVSS